MVMTANLKYGQIASATYADKTENFLWDGLALIQRSVRPTAELPAFGTGSRITNFINEPYITGGNPILSSKGDVMFNDMLGTTLGVKSGEQVNQVNMTAFGESKETTAKHNGFFTGKPHIGELGYAFLFRNYRPEQGKWQTADPLGYPDGWNQLAYANNRAHTCIDLLGTKVYWTARDLASSPIGNHHFLTFIPDNPNDFTGQTTDLGSGSQGWTNGGQNKNGNLVSTPNEANDLQSVREHLDPTNYPPGFFSDWDAEMHEIPTPQGMTDTEFINALQKAINEYQDNCPYSLVDENCAAWVNSMLERVGIPESAREALGEFFGVDWGEEDLIPRQYFE